MIMIAGIQSKLGVAQFELRVLINLCCALRCGYFDRRFVAASLARWCSA